jgi:cytochrome c-type biogenesis protein CcmH
VIRFPSIRRFAVALSVALIVLGQISPAALAAGRCPRTSEAALEQQVMCPVCGIPLALAASPQAQRERDFITELVNRCQSAGQIKAALVAQYGQEVLSLPPARGFALGLYLVPVLGLALALAGITFALRSMRRSQQRSQAGPAPNGPPPTEVELARLSAVLARDEPWP